MNEAGSKAERIEPAAKAFAGELTTSPEKIADRTQAAAAVQ